jgi:hypothetical protein
MSGLISRDLFVIRETAIIAAESALLEIVTELLAVLTPEDTSVPEALKSKEEGQFVEQESSDVPYCSSPVDVVKADLNYHHIVLLRLAETLRSLKERNRSRGFQLECMCQITLGDKNVSTPSEYSLEQPFDTSGYLMGNPQPPATDQWRIVR